MSYLKQHELGLAGLALLRKWLVGDKTQTKDILDEVHMLAVALKSTPFPSKKEVSKYDVIKDYEAWADTYDKLPNLLIDVEEPVVKSLLQEFPVGIALDAGCGTGRYSGFLQSLGHDVTGVDISPAMLNKAKIRNPKINFIQGDLTALPIKNTSIDLAICALTLTHLSDMEPVLLELFRVVKHGGHIILTDVNPWFVALGAQADFHDKAGKWGYITNHIHWHSAYIQTFNRIGLKVIKCKEPIIESKHVELARKGFSLKAKTVTAALEGLPLALVWVLEKS